MSEHVHGAPHGLRGDIKTMHELGSKRGHAKTKKLSIAERVAEIEKCRVARNQKMTENQQSESARNAALVRWDRLRKQTNE